MTITFTNYTNMLSEAELLFFSYLFAWKLPRRNHFYWRMIGACLVLIGLAFPLRSLNLGNVIANNAINYFALFGFEIAALCFSYHLHTTSVLFLAIVAYTLRHLIYLVWELTLTIVYQLNPGLETGFSWIWVVITIGACLLVAPFFISLLKRTWKYPEVVLPSAQVIIIAGVALVINVVLNIFVLETKVGNDALPLKYTNFVFNIFSSGMILYLLFGLIHETDLQQEIVEINQIRHEEEKQYALNRQTVDLINIKCHDLRHQIRALQTTHQTISPEELKNIEEATRIYDTRIKTGNASLDVSIQEKALLCAKDGIAFTCIADGSALDFMKEPDIYSLFGNILDNAIESVVRNNDPNGKSISLKVRKTPLGISAYEENPYAGSLAFKDGLPISTKGDDRYHGFGMKSIRAIVEHYQGSLSIDSSNGIFRLSILFPNPESK